MNNKKYSASGIKFGLLTLSGKCKEESEGKNNIEILETINNYANTVEVCISDYDSIDGLTVHDTIECIGDYTIDSTIIFVVYNEIDVCPSIITKNGKFLPRNSIINCLDYMFIKENETNKNLPVSEAIKDLSLDYFDYLDNSTKRNLYYFFDKYLNKGINIEEIKDKDQFKKSLNIK